MLRRKIWAMLKKEKNHVKGHKRKKWTCVRINKIMGTSMPVRKKKRKEKEIKASTYFPKRHLSKRES
jgi:hypothetical protein